MFQHNATKYFESKNISISDLNITSESLNDFLEKLVLLSKPSGRHQQGGITSGSENVTGYQSREGSGDDNCDYRCDGVFRNLLERYEGWHGYVALVVSFYNPINMTTTFFIIINLFI